MQRADWPGFCACVQGWWNRAIPAQVFETWWPELERFDAAELDMAVRQLLKEGSAHPPNLAQIIATLYAMDPPTLQEARRRRALAQYERLHQQLGETDEETVGGGPGGRLLSAGDSAERGG